MPTFPHYPQLDAMDCGPACLRMVAKLYGRNYSLRTLREKCHISREGVSLLGISDAAEAIGFHTVGVKLTWKQLLEEAGLPCIVHWYQRHFIVVYDIRKRQGKYEVSVADPASGLLKYDCEFFLKGWQQIHDSTDGKSDGMGIALLLEPTPKFYQEIGSLLSLILPFVTQSVVDKGIGLGDLPFVVTMLVAQLVMVAGQTANNLIRSWLSLHMTARVSISLISDFLSKLMRLPIAFFDSKMTGDIMQRIGDHQRIQDFLTNSLLSIVMAVVLFLKYRRKLDYMRFQEAAANQSTIVPVSGSMELFAGMRKMHKLKYAGIDLKASLAELEAAKSELRMNVTAYYLEVLCAKENMAAMEQIAGQLKVQEEKTALKVEAGKA